MIASVLLKALAPENEGERCKFRFQGNSKRRAGYFVFDDDDDDEIVIEIATSWAYFQN